ncbi:hypothetical protein AC579_2856 [Pseudocercospora musae]|uniref:Uncharacterized protein n=1 Tax=Pseudocercospora musae TaxID=113226 RepID=A0A139I3M2_9PEZI|nr:hypothetical protein AC579_2856 [Pseudocercospora musae]
MKTSAALTGLAGLATLSHGTTAFLSKDPDDSIVGCDHICKQRMLYTTVDGAARQGVSLALDAYNSAKWCVSEDWCPRTIDSTCSMITRRLIEAAQDGLKNGDDADFWDIGERSVRRATYWGADWGSRVLNHTSEEKGINPEAMKRLNDTLKNFPYMPEGSVVNRKALEEEMEKPPPAEDSSARSTPSMQLKNLAPPVSTASPDLLEIGAEDGGGVCALVPSFTTHWNRPWGHVTVDLCAQSAHTTEPHPALTSSHLATTRYSASIGTSTTLSVPATTIQDTPAASAQTTGSLVTAVLPGGSTAIVTAILPAATSNVPSAATDAVGPSSNSASLSAAAATTTQDSVAMSSHDATTLPGLNPVSHSPVTPSSSSTSSADTENGPSPLKPSSSSSHVGSTTSAAPTSIHSDSSSSHAKSSSTERTAGHNEPPSTASSGQSTAASSPSDSGQQPSQAPRHGSSDGDDDDDHLKLGLGVGLGIGAVLFGGAVWALGSYLHTRKMLAMPLKESVLEAFSFLKHLFKGKDEAVRRMANPNSFHERFLREPGQREMDRLNYLYEREIQRAIQRGDQTRRLPDFTRAFEPERAMALPDGTTFDYGLRRVFRYETYVPTRGHLITGYVRAAAPQRTWFHTAMQDMGYRRFVRTTPQGHPVLHHGQLRYVWRMPRDIKLIDQGLEWRNVRSRFSHLKRDAVDPVIQYLSKPGGAAEGDTLSSQPIVLVNGESIIVDSVGRVKDQEATDTIVGEMIAPGDSSPALRKLLKQREYLLTWEASGNGDVQLISREEFLNKPGNPMLRTPARVNDGPEDFGWSNTSPADWPGYGLDAYGNPIPGYNGTTTYSSLLSTVTPSIETTYLSTDYTTRTHYVDLITDYSTRTHVVDLTTSYEITALSTHFVTGSMPAPTTLATIGR